MTQCCTSGSSGADNEVLRYFNLSDLHRWKSFINNLGHACGMLKVVQRLDATILQEFKGVIVTVGDLRNSMAVIRKAESDIPCQGYLL